MAGVAALPRTAHAASVVAGMLVCIWGGEFFAFAVPGTSASPTPNEPSMLQLLNLEIHGNLLFSAILIVVSVLGALLTSSPTATKPQLGTATSAPA